MANRRQQANLPSRFRVVALMTMLAVCALGLMGRAVSLQLNDREFLQGQGNARHLRVVEVPAYRGAIVDRHGEYFAVSTPVDSAWANPQELLEQPVNIAPLAQMLEVDESTLSRRLAQRSEREFLYLKRHITPDIAQQIKSLNLPGVYLKREYRRYYPAGEVAAHVVGFTNIDDEGQEGLELAFDDWLSGHSGSKRVVRDRRGNIIEDVELVKEPSAGRELVLSIDLRLQYLAYRELKAAIAEHRAKSGSVVVLEVATGEVLAMVNQPSFNPNQRGGATANIRNRAVTDFYEPGSVIKPFAVAAALESGQYTPDTPVNTHPGTLKIGSYTITDLGGDKGIIDVTKILVKSSNVGISKLALSLKAEHLWSVYQRLGLGDATGSGFPGESPGILTHHRHWRKLQQASVSYGYGLSVTPIQLAQGFAAIANNGRMRSPSFVHGTNNPDSAVIDPMIASQIRAMLEAVTQPGGTGFRAAVPHYRIGGKTGTARKSTSGGYQNRYVASFVGMAPISDPQVVAVVVINDPSGDEYQGGQIAAPLFSRIMTGTLRLLNVPPDDYQASMIAGVTGS